MRHKLVLEIKMGYLEGQFLLLSRTESAQLTHSSKRRVNQHIWWSCRYFLQGCPVRIETNGYLPSDYPYMSYNRLASNWFRSLSLKHRCRELQLPSSETSLLNPHRQSIRGTSAHFHLDTCLGDLQRYTMFRMRMGRTADFMMGWGRLRRQDSQSLLRRWR